MISFKYGDDMGGIGSGRSWNWNAKDTVDDYRIIDVRRWQKEGMFNGETYIWGWFRHGKQVESIQMYATYDQKCTVISYGYKSNSENWEKQIYPIRLDWIPCNYGGKRPWFICPMKNCGDRVAILYLKEIFACRKCYQLSYPSQREGFGYRALRGINKLRYKLGWEQGDIDAYGTKPKGMHWETFRRLNFKHSKYVKRMNAWERLRFGSMCDLL